jgi:hypothetical protein
MANLSDIADDYARSIEAQATNAEHELREVEAEQVKLDERKAKALSAREAARSAPQRLADYDNSSCPFCWIGGQEIGVLRPIGGGNDTADMFRCARCKQVVSVDF